MRGQSRGWLALILLSAFSLNLTVSRGDQLDVLEQVRREQQVANWRATGHALAGVVQAGLVYVIAPHRAHRLLHDTRAAIQADADISMRCRETLLRVLEGPPLPSRPDPNNGDDPS
jgi:hypothetical protein